MPGNTLKIYFDMHVKVDDVDVDVVEDATGRADMEL